ncbi:MAG: N-acetyltransferase [Actinobacteria bacterium]|nr:N-acetyltransferase [Actinomycetota bacterium]
MADKPSLLQGARIELRPLDKSNIPLVLSWLFDPEVNRYMISGHEPITAEEEAAWYDTMAASDTDLVMQIHIHETGEYIGNTGMHHVDTRHGGAELGIMIGAKDHWGLGYGRDAIVTLLRHAFNTLGLHRVCLRCHPDNAKGIAAYEAVGFTRIGRERDAVLIEGEYQDHLVFDMLEAEFRERHSA